MSMEKTTEPPCPRCRQNPRHRYPKSGTLGPYCAACTTEVGRERRGWNAAERTCNRCGNPYRGNSRARAQLCKDCRTHCITCGEPKSAGDTAHTQCPRCRSEGKLCQTCGVNPIFANRTQCWDCIAADGAYAAQARDRIYSLAPGQYDQMLADQEGVCAISGQPETSVSKRTGKTYPLAVDHDRRCCSGDRSCGNCLRGLIRRNLNVALGMFSDDPDLLRAAADYIERHRAITPGG